MDTVINSSFSIKDSLPEGFHPQSRVWIYQANRLFHLDEVFEIEKILREFSAAWKSHGSDVKSYANLFYGRFVILIADESQVHVGGCSTDSSTRMIKEIEQRFKVNMFDRQLLAFFIKEKVEQIPLSQLQYAVDNGFITKDTLYFNNTVLTKKELEENWLTPAGNTWLVRYFKL